MEEEAEEEGATEKVVKRRRGWGEPLNRDSEAGGQGEKRSGGETASGSGTGRGKRSGAEERFRNRRNAGEKVFPGGNRVGEDGRREEEMKRVSEARFERLGKPRRWR